MNFSECICMRRSEEAAITASLSGRVVVRKRTIFFTILSSVKIVGELSKLIDRRSELWRIWIWIDRATATTSIRETTMTTLNLECWTKSPTRRIIKLTRRANTYASFSKKRSNSTIKNGPLRSDCSIKVSETYSFFFFPSCLVKLARP